MSREGDYLIGEAKHLLSCGMHPLEVCKVLNRTPGALASLASKRGETQVSKIFWQYKYQNRKG